MREVKFRGKEISTGKWVYGGYAFVMGEHRIIAQSRTVADFNYIVVPETVGQFTGLFDKHKAPIYEGDIVSIEGWEPKVYQIKFIYGQFVLAWAGEDSEGFNYGDFVADIRYTKRGEIVGNIFDSQQGEK